MSSGLLLEPMPASCTDPAGAGPRCRPSASSGHYVTKAQYITSNDPKGYM
ncbi:hypothetical protein OBBRIDRAFT_840468 [Obba rivulosa]|uniref:Uncharacterized protein n=1 Tax=Obba rivulosa TaxID=1052685 RepID=A0A8E2AMU8_9APHY|nr:hypothetical protein OBBRIDRAFT_840468 [Obba rivulosa]